MTIRTIYCSLHGYINKEYGFFVPWNFNNKVSVSYHSHPGSRLYISKLNEIGNPVGVFESGHYMFDVNLSIKNYTDGFIIDSGSFDGIHKGDGGLLNGSDDIKYDYVKKNFIIFRNSTNDEIDTHTIQTLKSKYRLSQLVFDLQLLYPGETLNIHIISCLTYDKSNNHFMCNNLTNIFGITSNFNNTLCVEVLQNENLSLVYNEFSVNGGMGNVGDDYIELYPRNLDTIYATIENEDSINFLWFNRDTSPNIFNSILNKKENITKSKVDSDFNVIVYISTITDRDIKWNRYNIVLYTEEEGIFDFVEEVIVDTNFKNIILSWEKSKAVSGVLRDEDITDILLYRFNYINDEYILYEKNVNSMKTCNFNILKTNNGVKNVGKIKLEENVVKLDTLYCKLFDKYGFENENINNLIGTMNQLCICDVFVIPYQFICYLFFGGVIESYLEQNIGKFVSDIIDDSKIVKF